MAKKKAAETRAKKAAAAAATRTRKLRKIFAEGHKHKFLVVVDETPECESALAFAASRAQRTAGQLALLYVIEPGTDIWLGVEEVAREEGFLMCPEGAATYAAYKQSLVDGLVGRHEQALLFNCASGLKYPMPAVQRRLDRTQEIDFTVL